MDLSDPGAMATNNGAAGESDGDARVLKGLAHQRGKLLDGHVRHRFHDGLPLRLWRERAMVNSWRRSEG